jgi:hypothetical protein
VKVLAPAAGMHPATLDRFMRDLRKADENGRGIPASGHGGRAAGVHLDHHHYALILLAMAAPTPGEAAKDASRLYDLPLAKMTPEKEEAGDFATRLGQMIANAIEDGAEKIREGIELSSGKSAKYWELSVCINPLMAWTSTTDGAMENRQYFLDAELQKKFDPTHPQDIHQNVRRVTVITAAVINIAAELYADTLNYEEKKNAAATRPLAGASAAADSQSAQTDMDSPSHGDPMPGKAKAQQPSAASTGRDHSLSDHRKTPRTARITRHA